MVAQFTVAGQRLEYEILGDGEPLLFVGNIAVPASAMQAFAPLLSSAGYQLILVDYLGTADASVETIAAHLGALLDDLDVEPWVWGYSQGACVVQELTLSRPDRVRGAVLVATRGRLSRFLAHYLVASRDIDAASVPDSVAAGFTLLAMLTPDLLSDDDQVEFALRRALETRRELDEGRNTRSLRASAAYDGRLGALRQMRVPCLVLSFEHDVVCPPQLGREVADAIPQCDYLEIPDAGHGGLVTHAAEVLAAVTVFVGRHRDGARRTGDDAGRR